jgi:hypothetical protein
MSVHRSLIELALNEVVSNEEGMRFQGLAVVLAKDRWPEFVACERKWDLGLDAYAAASVSPERVGKGLACSITGELSKIKKDADRAKDHFPDLQVIVFATAGEVTNYTAEQWKKAIANEYGWELILMSREDIITSLQMPKNASLCRTHLGIALPPPDSVTESLLQEIKAATEEVIAGWSRRLCGKPLIDLRLVVLDDKGAPTSEILRLVGLRDLLLRSRRLVIEGPVGRGKTTTLIQLGRELLAAGRIACLVDLPAWVRRNVGIFDFLAGMPEYQARNVTANNLARLNQSQQFIFLLNGWNELAQSESLDAARLIRELERSLPAAGIAVATRSHPIAPPLPGSSRFKVQLLTNSERESYLTLRLNERAAELTNLLNTDPVLNELTATPMILSEVTSLFEAGRPIPSSKLGVLDAVMRLLESSEEHAVALEYFPLFGMGRRYLEELGSSLVASGTVQISELGARRVVTSVTSELRDSGQIGTNSEPGDILTALLSHHVLERSSYPEVSFTFFHQQFQEFFGALRLMREIAVIAVSGTGQGAFESKYLNEPAWSEPLYMLAEYIGRHSKDEPLPNAVAMGKELIEMALPVDPVFAAELARLCGAEVWGAVRVIMGTRLRQLYRSQSSMCRTAGLAGMVATGSNDFKDVLVPLLSSEDSNSRLNTYRSWPPFHLSSLGEDWKQTVRSWNDEARVDFVSESSGDKAPRADVISFAIADPSMAVREALLSAAWWGMSPEEMVHFSQTLDDALFSLLIEKAPADYIPPPIRVRAAVIYTRIAETSPDVNRRLSAWKEAAYLGESHAICRLKAELSEASREQVSSLASRDLDSTIELIRKTDAEWVSTWVTQGILAGTLQGDTWMRMVRGIPAMLRDELLDRVTTEDLTAKRVPGVIPLLRTFADAGITKRLFRRLCELRPIIATSRTGDDKRAEAELARQLEDMLRQMPANMVVASILDKGAGNAGAVELEVIVGIFHVGGRDAPSLREILSPQLREAFRSYLKMAIDTLLAQDDFSGQLKGYFATVLAQVGDPSDLTEVERLIQADIERVRTGRLARIADHRSKQGNGASMSWTPWYVQAIIELASREAVDFLVRLLAAPDYELDAAWGLFQLALSERPLKIVWARNWPMRNKDVCLIWQARAGERPSIFVEPLRTQLAVPIKQHIESLIDERSKTDRKEMVDSRLKHLAVVLAELDGRSSAEEVLEILSIPETAKWQNDAWTRIQGIEALLMNGVVLPEPKTWEILEPVVNHSRSHSYDSQQSSLMSHAFSILLYTDDPSSAIARVREFLKQNRLSFEGFERLVRALGYSRCGDAVTLLREFAVTETRVQHLGDAWLNAVAQFDTNEARNLLLNFVDPSVPSLSTAALGNREDRLVARIAELARRDADVKQRLLALVNTELSPPRASLLGKILAELGDEDSILHALELLNDDAPSAGSYELQRRIEDTFVERRPYQDSTNTFTQVPRSSNEIRSKLLHMVLRDRKRRSSAYALLSRIELWRMRHGRPDGEPRNPNLAEGLLWPPEQPT